MAVIQTERSLYIWVGNELPKVNHDSYMKAAKAHVALLQRYERAHSQFQIVQQGLEDITFWQALGLEERPETNAYSKSPEMSHLYIDVSFRPFLTFLCSFSAKSETGCRQKYSCAADGRVYG